MGRKVVAGRTTAGVPVLGDGAGPEWFGPLCAPLSDRRTLELLHVLGGAPGLSQPGLLDHPEWGPRFRAAIDEIHDAMLATAARLAGDLKDFSPYELVWGEGALLRWGDPETCVPALRGAELYWNRIAVLVLHGLLPGGSPSLPARLVMQHGAVLALHEEVQHRLLKRPAGALLLDLDLARRDAHYQPPASVARIARRLRKLGRHDLFVRDLFGARDRDETDSITLEAAILYLAKHTVDDPSERLVAALDGAYEPLPRYIKERLIDAIRRRATQKREGAVVSLDAPGPFDPGDDERTVEEPLDRTRRPEVSLPDEALIPRKRLDALAPLERTILSMHLTDCTNAEIAEGLNLGGESTVRYRLSNILRRLRQP
jgi:DNA-binding NarL/FixJ family response regulator